MRLQPVPNPVNPTGPTIDIKTSLSLGGDRGPEGCQEVSAVNSKKACIVLTMLLFAACSQGKKMVSGEKGGVGLLRPFTFVESCDKEDPILKQILTEDMKGKKSPLELIHYYAQILNRTASHGGIEKKLDKLFLCGKPPELMDGYFHGITLSLKSGWDIYGLLEDARKRLGI